MPDAIEVLASLHDNLDAIRSGMDPAAFSSFNQQRMALSNQSAMVETAEEKEKLLKGVMALVQGNARAVEVLRERAPNVLGAATPPGGGAAAGTIPVPAAGGASPAPASVLSPAPAWGGSSLVPAAGGGSATPLSGRDTEPTPPSKWTPEVWIQLFKEGVTALLALILIGFTAYLALKAVGFAGDEKKVADSKDILQLMLGLAGVVIGYYFGRVPADARAAQAQEQAANATAKAEQVAAKSEELASQVDALPVASDTRGDGQARAAVERIRQVQAEVRALNRSR